jgi:hypothetical protein
VVLVDESRLAYRELLAVMPATITFNGITKPCVSQSLSTQRAEDLQGYIVNSAQQVTMDVNDFAAFVGILDRVSSVSVNGGDELVFIVKETHPDSAVVHLILASPN